MVLARTADKFVRTVLSALLLINLVPSVAVGDLQAADLDGQIVAARQLVDELLARFTTSHPDVVSAKLVLDRLIARQGSVSGALQSGDAKHRSPPKAAGEVGVANVHPTSPALPIAQARQERRVYTVEQFRQLCALPGIVGCFDFEGPEPLSSSRNAIVGALGQSADGRVRSLLYSGPEVGGGHGVRMNFAPEDNADHGSFKVTADVFGPGDLMTVQWSQWLSPSLVRDFDGQGTLNSAQIGGDGPKQLIINEIGDKRGCSFGQVVISNAYWRGIAGMYHGCGLWFSPRQKLELRDGKQRGTDIQPGGTTFADALILDRKWTTSTQRNLRTCCLSAAFPLVRIRTATTAVWAGERPTGQPFALNWILLIAGPNGRANVRFRRIVRILMDMCGIGSSMPTRRNLGW